MDFTPLTIDARHARRFVTPGRLAIEAIKKDYAGKPEQGALLLEAAAALMRSKAHHV